jgi:hypothetical protein
LARTFGTTQRAVGVAVGGGTGGGLAGGGGTGSGGGGDGGGGGDAGGPWYVAVSVAAVPGATSSWTCGKPSDHDEKVYGVPFSSCGEGAETELSDPTITSRVKGATALELPTPSRRPLGLDANVRATVRGWSGSTSVSVRPTESVTIRRSSRCDGYW